MTGHGVCNKDRVVAHLANKLPIYPEYQIYPRSPCNVKLCYFSFCRRKLRSHESQRSKQQASSAPRIVVSTWDNLGGVRQKAHHYSSMRSPEMKLWSIDHTSSWPRVRPPPEKVPCTMHSVKILQNKTIKEIREWIRVL